MLPRTVTTTSSFEPRAHGGRAPTEGPVEPARVPHGMGVDAALLFMALLWAANMIVLKTLLGYLPPPALSAVRFALVSLVAVTVLAVRGGPWTVARADVPRLVVSALSGITLYQILFMEGLERTTAFSSNVMQGTEPLFALVLLWATGSAVLARQWAGVLLALIGAAVFFLEGSGAHLGIVLGRGDILNLASAISFAVYGLSSGPLFDRYPGRTMMALTMGLGTLPLCLWSWFRVEQVSWSRFTPGLWVALVYSSVLPVYVGYWIWNWAIARKGLAHASLYIFVDIVLTGIFAYAFLAERFGPLRLLGAALIMTGVRLAR